jgi:hypothetical protein
MNYQFSLLITLLAGAFIVISFHLRNITDNIQTLIDINKSILSYHINHKQNTALNQHLHEKYTQWCSEFKMEQFCFLDKIHSELVKLNNKDRPINQKDMADACKEALEYSEKIRSSLNADILNDK